MKGTIGFIGCGNMAKAMIGGIVKSGLYRGEEVFASDTSKINLEYAKKTYGIQVHESNIEVARNSSILILAVKPNMYSEVIGEIKDYIVDNCIIVTIAAGITIQFMEEKLKPNTKVIRTMPNTPALVGEGMTAICIGSTVTDVELSSVVKIFESFGKAEIIDEKLMDVIPSVSGSSPAYVFMMIEALADGGVLGGIPRQKAYKMAAQAVLGAAKMVLETGEHPAKLKDDVCSPGGSTIEAVYTLEKNNFRGSVISAMESCTEKIIRMTNSNKE